MKTGIDRIVSTIKHGLGEKKVGLALGGGAARGIAHVGVIKVLEEHGIVANYVAGTSAGSLIGSLYCSGYTWQQIRDIVADVNWGDLVQPALFSSKGLGSRAGFGPEFRPIVGSFIFGFPGATCRPSSIRLRSSGLSRIRLKKLSDGRIPHRPTPGSTPSR
jgi:hypothetical protein